MQACVHCGQMHDTYAVTCPVTGARLAAATFTYVNEDELLVGSVVDHRYHVSSVIGQGTAATVFAVENVRVGRPLAMKVLRSRYLPFDQVQRVYEEACAAWAIPHPCLAEVVDAGALPDGAPYIVMERYDGETLATRLARDKMSIAAAVDLLMQILSAMDALHSRGVLARDPRPQNVFLVNRRGCRPLAKLLDVGLTRLVPIDKVAEQWEGMRAAAGGHPQREAGAVAAPYYLSPERARGDEQLTPASDLFVAMTMFYEALAGVRAFAGLTWSGLMLAIGQGSPRPLGELRPEIAPELDALVLRTLAADPEARPSSARELQDELRAIFENRRASTATQAAAAKLEAAPAARFAPLRAPSDSEPDSAATIAPMTAPSHQGATNRKAEIASAPPVWNREDEEEEDQTRADQRFEDFARAVENAEQRLPPPPPPRRPTTPPEPDEASAEHPFRTTPPRAPTPEEEAPATSRGDQTLIARTETDDETETMELTPEIRDRIQQMLTRGSPPPATAATAEPAAAATPEERRKALAQTLPVSTPDTKPRGGQ